MTIALNKLAENLLLLRVFYMLTFKFQFSYDLVNFIKNMLTFHPLFDQEFLPM